MDIPNLPDQWKTVHYNWSSLYPIKFSIFSSHRGIKYHFAVNIDLLHSCLL